MPTQIGFNSTVGEIFYINPVTQKEVSIFPTEYINKEAMSSFVDQWNADYSMTRIKTNLEGDERLTGDEVDYIIEQISIWEEDQESAKGEDANDDSFPWTEEAVKPITAAEKMFSGDEPKGIRKLDTVSEKELSGNITEIFEAGKQKKERKPRQTKVTSPGEKTGSKKLSAEDYITLLKEKIELTELITAAIYQTTDIPETVSKKGRDLILSMDREISTVIDKYLEMVQNL